ncbi:MAG: SLC13/DASS family transporter [Planctomycetes bacterium]|nr:SLC13/DASS family transporter [Planctomycetota bacterium]
MDEHTAKTAGRSGGAGSRFERARGTFGLIAAPVAFAAVLAGDFPALKPEAHRLAAVMGAVIVLWVTEAIPMPVTALLGASACVVLKVAPAEEVFAPFADQLMFLFVGSFILARAIFVHGLDRRLAFGVLSLGWVGAKPGRILFAFGAVTAFLSAWISNTATTAMMFAIGMAILSFLGAEERGGARLGGRYATGLMLMTSFAASIGGLATPIGTPPNVIGLGFIRRELGVEVPFFQWTLIGVPVVATLYLVLYLYLSLLCCTGVAEVAGSRDMLLGERKALGPLTRAQRSTIAACTVAAALWVLPGLVAIASGEESAAYGLVKEMLPEGVAALLGAALLFLLPGERGRRAISWDEAAKIDWGVVLLYGGGFALGVLASRTGLADAAGRGFTELIPVSGGLGLLAVSTVVAALVSEVTSNTASANIVVPVVISIARAAGADPLEPALGATFGASLGFMLPVSTPCNAIVYGSGHIPLGKMIRYGALLDVVGVATIVVAVRLLAPLVR